MSDEEKEPKRVTGRTPWDFAAEVTQRFGLSILILAGIVYGFYKFQDQALNFEQARQEATASVQQQLNEAHKELRETSVAIGSMNKTVVENIQGGFNTLQELQSRLKGLQEQANAEAKKAEDAIALQKNADEAKLKAVNDLEKVRLEHERLQKLRVAKSGPFRDKVKSLISLLSDKPLDDPNIGKLSEEIRQDYLVDPLALFEAVAKDPNVENLQRLSELDGLKFDVLMEHINKNESGFVGWMLGYEDDPNDFEVIVGIVTVTEGQAKGIVALEIDKEQGRVWDVDLLHCFIWVSFPSVHNWDVDSAVAIIDDSSEEFYFESVSMMPPGWSSGQINLADAFRYGLIGDEDYGFLILAGEDPNLKLITLNDLRTTEPKAYRQLEESRSEASTAIKMMHKAETFTAATVVPITLDRGLGNLGNLRATIIQTLDAAVRRDAGKRQNLARENFPNTNWGLLAAMALNLQFNVRRIEVLPNQLDAVVFCSVQDHETEEILTAKMYFGREKALPQSQWYLTGFSPPERRQSALQKAY